MKNWTRKIASIVVLGLLLIGSFGCAKEEANVLKVGATPVPHAELLAVVKEDLKEAGVTLEVVEFTDYVKPNLSLNDGEIDANFFQHVPYLESFAEERSLELSSVGTVHVEPLGLYSETAASIEALPAGATIAIPSDSVNGGRALLLLESEGLLVLKDDAGLEATEKDIVENPHGLIFTPIEAAQIPRILVDVDAGIINGNYALEAGLNPADHALLLEGAESPYANILVVRKGDEELESVQILLEALQSEKVRAYILETYGGGVVPAF